ncbi:MAG TPA: hypothetical protein O0X97_04915 [Methanocorpusculum sp.]|nr:hypothetical protein [Methanocorpusculum sp.]
MTDKRTVTVSVTINLGNYENLRLEVCDAAETKEDADELRHYLASILDGYGNNNAAARTAIEKYKEHILEDSADASASAGPDEYALSSEETESESEPSGPVIPETPAETPAVSAEKAPANAPAESSLPPAPVVDEENTQEFVCSRCGAPVNKVQRDVSMLFNNKILCKNCMK